MLVGVAKQMAAAEGIEIVDVISEETGEHVFTYEYDADNIAKISIDVKASKVNIIGGAAKPYIELVNFAEGMYEFSSANRQLTVNNNSDYSTFEGWTTAFLNFKGLRSLVNYYQYLGLEREINIYICDDKPVNIIDCKVDNGAVDISGAQAATDYNIEIGNGELSVAGVKTSSALNVKLENGNVEISDSTIRNADIDIENGSMSANAEIIRMKVEVEIGDVDYSTKHGVDTYNIKATSNVGKVYFEGAEYNGELVLTNRPTDDMLDIDVGVGDIRLTSIPNN